MVVHRKMLAMVSLTVFIFSAVSASEIKNADSAINVAGKQRMLSFRILKDYMMVSMESNYKNPKKDMADSIKEFEDANDALAAFSKDPQVQSGVEELKDKFKVYKEAVSKPFDKSKVIKATQEAMAVRDVAHKLTLKLAEIFGNKSGEIVNKAGMLRAFSQGLASAYLLKTLGVDTSMIKKVETGSMKIFRDNLDFLNKADIKDQEISKRLKKLEKIYLFFQVMNESDNRVPTIVVKKSDKMLKYANEIVDLYLKKGDK